MCQALIVVQQHADTPTVACTVHFNTEELRTEALPLIHETLHPHFSFLVVSSSGPRCRLPPNIVLGTANGPIRYSCPEHLCQYIEEYVLLKRERATHPE